MVRKTTTLSRMSQVFVDKEGIKVTLKGVTSLLISGLAPAILWILLISPISAIAIANKFPYGKAPLWQLIFGIGEGIVWVYFYLIFILIVAYAHIVLLGIPFFLLGRLLNAINLWSVLIMSFIIGAAPTGLLLWVSPGNPQAPIFGGAAAMGLFGTSGGLAFWLIWHHWAGRDINNTLPPPPSDNTHHR